MPEAHAPHVPAATAAGRNRGRIPVERAAHAAPEPAAARRWVTLALALDELAAARATGAVHVDGPDGGSVYLVEGEVYYVHAGSTPGVDCLLQASGTVPSTVFQTAWAAGAAAGRVGEVLVGSGALSRGEAELCTAAAITDGAFVLLTAGRGPARFAPGERHWWGELRRIGVAALDAQVGKRRRLLERTPPTDVDDQPVLAARRLGRHHVVLTDLQWELVVHADGRRTPRELARLLGRSSFSAVLETRRLVSAGLMRVAPKAPVDPPPPAVSGSPLPRRAARRAAAEPVPATAEPEPSGRTEPAPRPEAQSAPRPEAQSAPRPEAQSAPRPEGQSGSRTEGQSAPLPRRQPGAALKGAFRSRAGGEATPGSDDLPASTGLPPVPEPDSGLLARVRTALEGLR
jgi:hypothetical protein